VPAAAAGGALRHQDSSTGRVVGCRGATGCRMLPAGSGGPGLSRQLVPRASLGSGVLLLLLLLLLAGDLLYCLHQYMLYCSVRVQPGLYVRQPT